MLLAYLPVLRCGRCGLRGIAFLASRCPRCGASSGWAMIDLRVVVALVFGLYVEREAALARAVRHSLDVQIGNGVPDVRVGVDLELGFGAVREAEFMRDLYRSGALTQREARRRLGW